MAKIALDFKDERGGAALGIRRLPAQELARERVHTGGGLAGPDGAENRHAGIEAALGDRQPLGGRALGEFDRVMHFADDDGRAVRRRRKRPLGKAGPEPQTDAHTGEPNPRCADEELAGQQRGHAGRDVVPRDDGGVKVRRVIADEHRHGIGLGKHAGPRPGARSTDAADDETRADESVNHRAARRRSSSRPRAGRGAFQQGYIETGATPTKAGGMGHPVVHRVVHPPPRRTAPAVEKGGSLPSLPSPLARFGSSGPGRKTRTKPAEKWMGVWYTPRYLFGTPPPGCAYHLRCPAPCPAPCHAAVQKRGAPSDRHLGGRQPDGGPDCEAVNGPARRRLGGRAGGEFF